MPKSDSQLLREIHGKVCSLETSAAHFIKTQDEHGNRITTLEKKAWYEKGIFTVIGVLASYLFNSHSGG